MKALCFDGKKLELIEKDKPKLLRDEALIKVKYAGICNTDLEIFKGYMDFVGIPGHEFVGIVEIAASPSLIGKMVVGEINLSCGKCEMCLTGIDNHCPHRTVLGILQKDGVFAEYVTLPERNLHIVPKNVTDLQAVFTEPLAAACEIVEQIEILPEYQVLIIGDGKLAQLIARVISLYSSKLLVVGKHLKKLQLLRESKIPVVSFSEFKNKDQSYNVVVEATGSWSGWDLALKKVRPQGFIVLKSTYVGEYQFNLAPLVINEINLIGSRCGPFKIALQLLNKGTINPCDLISDIIPFSNWEEAFRLANKSDSLKVVLDLES
jgi:threonine dehydrogenase-like Zn-dependent dehydrogenase